MGRIRYTIIVGREKHLPSGELLLHFVFFLSPFLFTLFFILHGLRPVSCMGNRALPCVQLPVVLNATNLSQAIQNLFTHIGRRRGILNTSAREAAIPQLASQPIFYFSFTPLFQICVVNRQSAAVPFPPTGSGALHCGFGAGIASIEMPPDGFCRARPTKTHSCKKTRRTPSDFVFQPAAAGQNNRMRCAAESDCIRTVARERVLSENLTKISQGRPRRDLAKAGGMRYT